MPNGNMESIRILRRLSEYLSADEHEHSGPDLLDVTSTWSDYTLDREGFAYLIINDGDSDLLGALTETEKSSPFLIRPGDNYGELKTVSQISLKTRDGETTQARYMVLSLKRPPAWTPPSS